MQNVCIAFWAPQGSDLVAKVTDIYTTDPSDPSHCATSQHIKLPRSKVAILYTVTGLSWTKHPVYAPAKSTDPRPIHWHSQSVPVR